MLSQTFSRLAASFKVQAKALLGAGLLFLAACSPNNPLDPLENKPAPGPNQNPEVIAVTAEPASLAPGQSATITVEALDPDGDALSYSWYASDGEILGNGNAVTFLAGHIPGTAYVDVEVNDGRGGVAGGSVVISIQ
jgi:hypothetical protein